MNYYSRECNKTKEFLKLCGFLQFLFKWAGCIDFLCYCLSVLKFLYEKAFCVNQLQTFSLFDIIVTPSEQSQE